MYFSSMERALSLPSFEEYLKQWEELRGEQARGSEARKKECNYLRENASWKLLTDKAIPGKDDIFWDIFRERFLENKEEPDDFSDLAYIAYVVSNPKLPSRSNETMRTVRKRAFQLIRKNACKASDEEIVAILEDCLELNKRDLWRLMACTVIHSEDPRRIIEKIKDCKYHGVDFSSVIRNVIRHAPSEGKVIQEG